LGGHACALPFDLATRPLLIDEGCPDSKRKLMQDPDFLANPGPDYSFAAGIRRQGSGVRGHGLAAPVSRHNLFIIEIDS